MLNQQDLSVHTCLARISRIENDFKDYFEWDMAAESVLLD